MKKTTLIVSILAAAIALIIAGLVIFYLVSQKDTEPEEEAGEESIQQEISFTSEGANWTPEQNKNLQQGLVDGTNKYLEAVSYTNAVFFTDIENTTYEEWKEKLDKAIQLWEELEQIEQDMDIVFDDLGIPEYTEEQASIPNYNLASLGSFLIPSVYAITEGYQGIPELGAVTAVFDSVKHGNKIRGIMNVFGWDRQTAFYHLKREQELLKADAWDKAGDNYQRWETAARAVKDVSKVTVFVGMNIITAGGASATVGALGVIQTGSIIIGGTALVFEVAEDVNIAIGNEDDAAVLHNILEKAKPLTELVSIISLQDLGDPGNLFYIVDKSRQIGDFLKDKNLYITNDKDTGKLIFSTEPPKDINIPEADPEKAKTENLPEGNYKIGEEKIEVKKDSSPKIEEEKEEEEEGQGYAEDEEDIEEEPEEEPEEENPLYALHDSEKVRKIAEDISNDKGWPIDDIGCGYFDWVYGSDNKKCWFGPSEVRYSYYLRVGYVPSVEKAQNWFNGEWRTRGTDGYTSKTDYNGFPGIYTHYSGEAHTGETVHIEKLCWVCDKFIFQISFTGYSTGAYNMASKMFNKAQKYGICK